MSGSSTPRANALPIGLLVILVPAFVLCIFLPNTRHASELRNLIAAEEDNVLRITARIALRDRLREQLDQTRNVLQSMLLSVPISRTDEQILGELQTAAHVTGAHLASVMPCGRLSAGPVLRARFRVEIAGSFQSVAGFLKSVSEAPRAYLIDDLSIERCDSGEPGYEACGYITLIAFSCRRDFNDSAGNSDRLGTPSADSQIEGPKGPDWLVSAPTEVHR